MQGASARVSRKRQERRDAQAPVTTTKHNLDDLACTKKKKGSALSSIEAAAPLSATFSKDGKESAPAFQFLPANVGFHSCSTNEFTPNPHSFMIGLNCAASASRISNARSLSGRSSRTRMKVMFGF